MTGVFARAGSIRDAGDFTRSAPCGAALDKAAQEIAKTNAQIFASTFEGKWGGYNPDGMEHWDDQQQSAQLPFPNENRRD